MKNPAERLEWALKRCEQSHVRMTSVRAAILELLTEQRKPVNLDSISHAAGVRGQYDATTVYRTLMVFRDAVLFRELKYEIQKSIRMVLCAAGERCIGAVPGANEQRNVRQAVKGVKGKF